jgi:hypothetical protein
MGGGDVARKTSDSAVPAMRVRPSSFALADQKISSYSAPFAGIAIPSSFMTICKSFQVSFF